MRNSTKTILSRSLSGILAFLTVLTLLASLSMVPVFAADDEEESRLFQDIYLDFYTNPNYNPEEKGDADDYVNPDFTSEEKRVAAMTKHYTKGDFELYVDEITGEVAIKDVTTGDYLFTNPYDISEISLSSVGDSKFVSQITKRRLLSQVNISYTDNNTAKSYNSFTDSALLEQIRIKKLRGGVRIEYSIGQEETRTLVPRIMNLDRYKSMLIAQLKENIPHAEGTEINEKNPVYFRFISHYEEIERSRVDRFSKDLREAYYTKYPVLKDMDIAVFAEDAKAREIKLIENYIKTYCPEYTFEELDKDHKETGYTSKDKAPANFKMALEYYLNENGVEVRFPANGLTFDEGTYQLSSIDILQYMGAGSNDYNGYTFIPDGSGTLIRFEETSKTFELTGKVYGQDYAYQEISNANQEVYRMPVFGVVSTNEFQNGVKPIYKYEAVYETDSNGNSLKYDGIPEQVTIYDPYGEPAGTIPYTLPAGATSLDIKVPVYEYETNPDGSYKYGDDGKLIPIRNKDGSFKVRTNINYTIEPDSKKLKYYLPVYKAEKPYSTGFFAVVTEGDALTNITSSHGGNQDHIYNSVYCNFNPRPKDSYNLSEAISIGSNTTYTVVSERKYTGSFKINYIMLTDPDNSSTRNPNRTYYDTSYVGMAKAYRDYLDKTGQISRLTAEDIKENIPLFIEVFGATQTDETFLSIPITVDKALTSFDDMKVMIKELKDAKVTNLNFRLTGFTNGGLVPTVPTKVKFEKVVGGNSGFREFLKYAADEGIGVYPEFDFAYMMKTEAFDGFSYRSDAVKTIDNRYITKRAYDAVLQTFTTTGKICISPCVYRDFYDKFNKSFMKVLDGNTTNISLGTLGSDLNSDFDEDDPYNREDAKSFTVEMLKQFTVNNSYGKLMIDSGNAYTIPYASVVLNAPLDSSRYLNASESVPFFGMVYHGYLVFAGEPTNMAGDIHYETLKILENGATLYMMLSYQNVELLKEDKALSKYYAINYDIWKETLLSKYDEAGNRTQLGFYDKLNDALKGVQLSLINDHRYLDCIREFSDVERENIKADSQKALDKDKLELEAELDYYTNKQHLYELVSDKYAQKIVAAGLVDNSTELDIDMFAGETDPAAAMEALIAQGNKAVIDKLISYYETLKNEVQTKINNITLGQDTGDLDALNQELAEYNALLDKYNMYYTIEDEKAAELEVWGITDIDSVNTMIVELNAEIAALKLENYIADNEAKIDRAISDGTVVYVEYKNDLGEIQWFVLNYNNFIVNTVIDGQTIQIGAKDFYNSKAAA